VTVAGAGCRPQSSGSDVVTCSSSDRQGRSRPETQSETVGTLAGRSGPSRGPPVSSGVVASHGHAVSLGARGVGGSRAEPEARAGSRRVRYRRATRRGPTAPGSGSGAQYTGAGRARDGKRFVQLVGTPRYPRWIQFGSRTRTHYLNEIARHVARRAALEFDPGVQPGGVPDRPAGSSTWVRSSSDPRSR